MQHRNQNGGMEIGETGLEGIDLPSLGITVFDQQRLLDNPIIDFQQDHGGGS